MRREAFLILLAMVCGMTIQQCTIGCLKCNNQNQCLLCDITQGYQLLANSCRLNTQTNCALFSQNGNCVQCANNFYMDINSQNCVAIGSTNVIANCLNYNSAQACILCNKNNFLVGGSCNAVNNTIANCISYSSNNVCMSCNQGFLLSNDMSSCVALPSANNCLFYSYIGCRQCNSGFVVNQNFYFSNFNSPTSLNNYLANMVQPSTEWIGLNVCQSVTVNNCAVYTAFNVCARCNSGYYLSSGACFLFPLNIIFGCATYSGVSICSSCQSGMYLNQNMCLSNTIIENCVSFSTTASTTTCTICNNGFFLQSNSCVPRTASKSTPNCQTPHPQADVCQVCTAGFDLTSDNLACLPTVPNCSKYSASTFQSAALQCSLCVNSFYLSSTGTSVTCVSGSVASCLRYQVSQNVCIECVNGFYLNNLVCTPHVSIPNCVSYHGMKSNYCATCASGYFSFAYTSVCVQTTVRANCASYHPDGNSCQNCVPNFYLVSGPCNAIPSTFSNCNTFSGTACTLCNSGYMVNTLPTAGTCTLPLDYINAAVNSPCSVMTAIPSTVTPIWIASPGLNQVKLECRTCGNYMYGYNPHNAEAICVNQNQLSLYAGFIHVNNCKRYGLNYGASPSVVCMECASGQYISGYQNLGMKASPYVLTSNPTGIQCTSTCNFASTSSSAVIPDDFFGFVNICIAATAITFVNVNDFVSRGMLQFPGNCRRYARFAYRVNDSSNVQVRMTADAVATQAAALNRIMSADYKCIVPAPSVAASNVVPTNYLYLADDDTDVEDQYPYEVVSLITARVSEPADNVMAFDFSTGFSNTVDSSSTYPTVFNYKGILERIDSSSVAPTVCTNCKNHHSFCDIFLRYTGTAGAKKGYAFTTLAEANAAFYTPTTAPATATDYAFVCLRCQFGYQLSYTASAVADNASMPSCVSMQNCASSTTVYGGLTTFLNSVFSCHLCGQTAGSTTFPSIWIETDALANTGASSGTLVGWTVKGVYTSATSVTGGHGFKCFAAPSQIVSGASAIIVPNCAAFGYITPITLFADGGAAPTNDPERAVCLACAANSYPTYVRGSTSEMSWTLGNTDNTNGRIPGWSVIACTPSQNCDTSVINMFNSCGKCDTSKENLPTPVYYAFMDFTLSNCFQTTTQNCFILATGSSQTGQNICDVCKAGFILNDDKVCEQFRVPNQSVTSANFNSGWFVRRLMGSNSVVPSLPTAAALASTSERVKVRINYLLSFSQHQYGVTSCQSGWIQFPTNIWAPRVCVWSSYIYNNTQFPSTTQYINNCLRYNVTQMNSRHVCGGCNVGFIPTIDGTSCVSSTPLPNCLFAQTGANAALCYECADNFFNVNGQCSNTPIANCRTYVNSKWSFTSPSILQCASCLNGFVLSADMISCTNGQVNNCYVYKQGSSTQCSECAPSFSLMTLANNLYYCYPLPTSLNCQKMQSSSSTSGLNYDTVSCAVCNYNNLQVFGIRQWTSLGLVSQPQTLCMKFTAIANCKVYDQANPKINENTFGCLECDTGYWYSSVSQTCFQRVNNPSHCIKFSPTEDTCMQCGQGSFLSVDKVKCMPFPNGIFMCSQYSSATTCTQCFPGYYLSANSCFQSSLIPNCQVYSANFTCSACMNGLFLYNATSCVAASASNCLTFASITACSSCYPGQGLQTSNGITSCVFSILPNCLNATTIAPFTCLICSAGYYPNPNGVCVMVSKAIANCLSYDSASTCTICNTGSILNVARTSCNSTYYTSKIDPNCQQSFLMPTPACVQCSLGSFFSNGTCVQCRNNTYASGCMSCDPLDDRLCLVCRPNYYMNSVGVCMSVSPTTDNNSTTVPDKKSLEIMKSIALCFILIGLMFDQK